MTNFAMKPSDAVGDDYALILLWLLILWSSSWSRDVTRHAQGTDAAFYS